MVGKKCAAVVAAVACLCLAGIAAAQATTTGGGDTTIVPGLADLLTIACPTSGTCVAGGDDASGAHGASAVINTASGTVKTWSGLKNTTPGAMACPSKKTCLALVKTNTTEEIATISVSSGAMKIISKLPAPRNEARSLSVLACAGTKTCYAAGWQGDPVKQNGTTGVLIRLSVTGKVEKVTTGGGGYSALACESSTTCLAATATAKHKMIFAIVNGKLGKGYEVSRGSFVEQLACFGTRGCYALGLKSPGSTITSELWPVNPKTGRSGNVTILRSLSGTGTGGAMAMACYGSTQCVVVGSTSSSVQAAAVAVTKGKAGKLVTYPALNQGFAAVACASKTACYAVGADGSGNVYQSEVTRV